MAPATPRPMTGSSIPMAALGLPEAEVEVVLEPDEPEDPEDPDDPPVAEDPDDPVLVVVLVPLGEPVVTVLFLPPEGTTTSEAIDGFGSGTRLELTPAGTLAAGV